MTQSETYQRSQEILRRDTQMNERFQIVDRAIIQGEKDLAMNLRILDNAVRSNDAAKIFCYAASALHECRHLSKLRTKRCKLIRQYPNRWSFYLNKPI